MASQEGFEYERSVYTALDKLGIATGGPPAGAAHNRPDLFIKKKNTTAGVELKNQPTAAGSLVLQYYDNKWHFGPTKGATEKEFLAEIGRDVDILKILNKNWKDPALIYEGASKKYPGYENWKDAYDHDIKTFQDQYVTVDNGHIAEYYARKNTQYLNIGTHGFFLFKRHTDPLGLQKAATELKLPKIPVFSDNSSATTKIRVRVQYKGADSGYQYAFTLQFGGVFSSPYNLGPLSRNSSSAIDVGALKNNLFLKLFSKS